MPFSGSSPTPSSTRPARQGSISHRHRLLSTAALSVDEEIRRSEGGGFAVPMDGSSPVPVVGGAVRRLKADDPEAGLPLHRRRGSLPRQAPDPNLRPPPVVNSAARAEASSPVPISVDLPPSPSSSTRTFTPAYSVGRARPPRSPLSTPQSELPPVDPLEPSSTSFFPTSPGRSPGAGGLFVFPVPIPSSSVSHPQPPAPNAVDDDALDAAASPSRRVVPTLHLRTASGADVGLSSIQSLPSLPRGPSGFRGLGRRPSVSGSPSPTREVFWGGQAGTARKSVSAAITPVGSDDGQGPLTPGGSVRILRPMPSPRGEFNLDTGKMLIVRARVATPKGERSAFLLDATKSCPPLHSPLPSPLSSPSLAAGPDLPAGQPTQQPEDSSTATAQQPLINKSSVAQGSPPDPSRRTSILSFTSGSSGLSTSSSATAGTSTALDTPSLVEGSMLASPKPHLTVHPPALVPEESEPITPVVPAGAAEPSTLSPSVEMLRHRLNAARPSASRNGSLRRPSAFGALKLSLTDDERAGKGPSRFPTLLLDDVNDDESDDLLSAFPSSGHRTSESSLSRKSSGPSLVADLRKSSTASYMSFSSVRSEPFAYDDGWSGSDDSDNESIPLPKPRPSISRSSSGLAPPLPTFPRRSSGVDLAPALSSPALQSDSVEGAPGRSSSLPVPLSSPNSSLRSTSSVGTARPLSQGDPRSSMYSTRSESNYFPTSAAAKVARPSSTFSLTGDGSLVTHDGRVLPRPKLDQADPWGDVEIAYQSSSGVADRNGPSSKASQQSGWSQNGSSLSARKWEEAAERLPERKKLLNRRESATSSASSHGSSSDKYSAQAAPKQMARAPPSAMKKIPAPSMAPIPVASPPTRSIPVRKSSSSTQLRSAPTGSVVSGSSPSRLPSPAIKKSYSGNIPQYRSPAGSATSSPAGLKQAVLLPAIEPLRITRPGATSPQPPAMIPSAVTDKPLPVPYPVSERLSPAPATSDLRPRTPPRSQSEVTTPTQTPVATAGRERSSEPSPSTVQPGAAPLAVGSDAPLSPRPAFGPAAGRRMSKRPSVPKVRPPPAMQHRYYEAPPLPPLPSLPAALASQPR